MESSDFGWLVGGLIAGLVLGVAFVFWIMGVPDDPDDVYTQQGKYHPDYPAEKSP